MSVPPDQLPVILGVDPAAEGADWTTAMPSPATDAAVSPGDDQPDEGDRKLIETWTRRIQGDKAHWNRKFKQMARDADFARGKQWPGDLDPENEDRYVANIVQRHIQQRVASLYAKNPRFIARRRKQLDFQLWDESAESYTQAMQALQMAMQSAMAGVPLPPEAMMALQQAQALMADVEQGKQRRQMTERIGKTLEVLFASELSEQQPPFKKQMKQLVRRTLTTCVGWLKLGFERVMEPRPEDVEKIRDLTDQVTHIQQMMAELEAGDARIGDMELKQRELEQAIAALEGQPQQVVREGLVFDFPPPTSVIPDRRCRQLQGFVGARHVAQEFLLPPSEVQRIYGLDITEHAFTAYGNGDGDSQRAAGRPARGDHSGMTGGNADGTDCSLARVWEVQDKATRQVFAIAEGCPVYLKPPSEPEVRIDRFWTLFPLTFNDIEHEKDIYPPSDVELMRSMQLEHNRARQALREHRRAAAPGWASPRGALTEDDKQLLADHEPHSTIELDGMGPNQKVGDILQAIPTSPIDQNLYETGSIFDDVLKVAGVQEANIGGTSGATATETSIAEGTRMASVASNVDDLDDFMNEVARAASQVLLAEFGEDTVKKIAGPGAVWPQLSAQEISDELLLEVEAGSSGKPNRAAEIKNYMDLAPILMQIPGINPTWLAKEGIRRMDDRLDLTDAFLDGLPSIQSMSVPAAAPPTGGPDDPAAQGPQGANNAPRPPAAGTQPNERPAPGAAPRGGQAMSPIG